MAKIKNAIFGLSASGSLSGGLTYLRRMRQQIVEKTPVLKDAKTTAQLSWRHMFLKVVALWHALSPAEQAEWESAARPKHMTGYAWFVSQALRPNPGIYLPLQGGTMAGIIDMDGYPIQDLLDPVNPQDADTEAARDAAIAAALAGSLTVDIHGWDGANWQKLLVQSPANHNLRTILYDGVNPIATGIDDALFVINNRGLMSLSLNYHYAGGAWRRVDALLTNSDNIGASAYSLKVGALLYGYDGSTFDRLRTYGTGVLKVGRAEIGLSDIRLVATGQVKAAAGLLYWMLLNPSAGNSVVELSDDLDGAGAIKADHFDTARDGHMIIFDPPLEFATGIHLKTFTNMTSITFGYK